MSLGGNLGGEGAVEGTLRWALHRLRAALGPLSLSSLYRTRAVSSIPQPDYLNAAATGWTALPADAVLAIGKRLELTSGRALSERNAPRPLDIDLLLFGETVLRHPELTLPHPRLAERRFMLEPLAEIAPERRVPLTGRTVRELLRSSIEETDDRIEAIENVGWSGGPPDIA